jgi:UDP-glucose 4-epimerase
VLTVAELIRETAAEMLETDISVELVENPRSGETMVKEFSVDISTAREVLGWDPLESVDESIRRLLNGNA